ncbi:CBO0543 family protein [Ammoniphilus sp. YIM 78166]|uniref:CBO0543 family protein n=1 Tax=Ammoniphilus sp. YIM 78166 TaxID=1644106 RepID=UPI00196A3553|nr:CBO0543 family protein [Ammoniphilus sp. YIM 78166]
MTYEEGIREVSRGYQMIKEATDIMSTAIVEAFYFTWQWWFGVALMVLPWIIWFLLRKKESTNRLLQTAFLVIILSIFIDMIAFSKGAWSYPMEIVPISPMLLLPYHFSLVPVTVIFFIQYKTKVNMLVKGIIFAAVGAFVGMPFFTIIGFYDPKGWPYSYDFFLFLSIYLIGHWSSRWNQYEKIENESGKENEVHFLRRKEKVR